MPIVSKPAGLANILSWMNWNAGDFIKFSVFGIGFGLPPFSFQPGNMIEAGIDLLLWPINTSYDLANSALSNVWDALQKATSALFKIDDWLLGAVQWFAGQVTSWWQTIIPGLGEIFSWTVVPIWEQLTVLWDWFIGIDDWFKDKVAPVYAWIGTILANYVTKVSLADLFKPFQEFMDFWFMVKDEMVKFFSDPLQWAYDKMDEFFERFW